MNMPGFSANACLSNVARGYATEAMPADFGHSGKVVPQRCAVDALALCSPWLQSCFYGFCGWARIFGSGSCTTCMTWCLWITNPAMAALCVNCVQPGPCGYGTISASLGCPYNICA